MLQELVDGNHSLVPDGIAPEHVVVRVALTKQVRHPHEELLVFHPKGDAGEIDLVHVVCAEEGQNFGIAAELRHISPRLSV